MKPDDVEAVAKAINDAWVKRYGGQPVETVMGLTGRVAMMATDRDVWVQNAGIIERAYRREARLMRVYRDAVKALVPALSWTLRLIREAGVPLVGAATFAETRARDAVEQGHAALTEAEDTTPLPEDRERLFLILQEVERCSDALAFRPDLVANIRAALNLPVQRVT